MNEFDWLKVKRRAETARFLKKNRENTDLNKPLRCAEGLFTEGEAIRFYS